MRTAATPKLNAPALWQLLLAICWTAAASSTAVPISSSSSASIFAPDSTPADSIFSLSLFVLTVKGAKAPLQKSHTAIKDSLEHNQAAGYAPPDETA